MIAADERDDPAWWELAYTVGMVRAFERAGYDQFARRRTYRRALAVPDG